MLRVAGCDALVVVITVFPRLRDAGARLARGVPPPVPLRVTVCVLPDVPPLLSVTVNVPLSTPFVVGDNVTLMEQELAAAKVPPQVLVCPKLALAAMPVIVSAAVPLLVSVTICAVLVVPTA